ncbi:MAG: right-handed parallel beta-helix repeat-containing protein [Planctomycetes bacterium]|nr:right-handed parallel beta-helix repeat-containing protein [Planctomycetota bacterium]
MRTCWITSSLLAVCLVTPAEGAKLKVPGDFGTIQAAVNAAGAGDIVEVSSGTYVEDVSISGTDITLRAKSGHKVYIDAGGAGVPLSIGISAGITVQDIYLRNTADSDGLSIALSNGILIKGCTVDDVFDDGISAGLTSEIVIEECTVKNVGGDGIVLLTSASVVRDTTVKNTGENGIIVMGVGTTIEGNTIKNAADAGVKLGDDPTTCESCLVVDNDIEDVWDGVYLDATATGNSVLDNNIENAEYDGIELQDGAEDNIVSGNTIRSSGDSGIECASDYCLHSRNKVKNALTDGILIEGAAQYCLFYKNKVKQSVDDGFEVDGDSNVLVENQAKNSGAFDLNDDTAPGANAYLGNTFTTIAP